MNWYLAKIVFQVICDHGDHTPQFDEQLRLVSAHTKQDALKKARAMGERGEEIISDEGKRMVEWKFIDVPEIEEIKEMTDGVEIYSAITETDSASNYISMIRSRAIAIQTNTNHQLIAQ